MDMTVDRFLHRRFSLGFTLVELLVVIAIVAVLASLIVPVLGASKERARAGACRNHLRQLQFAWLAYAGDHGGEMVPNEEGRPFGFWEGVRHSWVLGNARRDATPDDLRRGSLYPYLDADGVYACPSERATLSDDPETARLRTYSLNGELNYWLIADQQYGLPILQAFHNESQLTRPDQTYGFLDVNADTIDSGIFGMPGPPARTEEELKRNLLELDRTRWLHLPGELHGGGANIGFLDGHVEPHAWRFPGKQPTGSLLHRPVNDDDLEDLRWLVRHGAAWQRYF